MPKPTVAKAKAKKPKTPSRTRVPYAYLDRQYGGDIEPIWKGLRELVKTGDYTIGAPVYKFEARLAKFAGTKHCVGTNTGTDALIMALKGLDIGPGAEVITQVNTFFATAGAIVDVGARPVFVDVDDQYQIDANKIEAAITPRTKALLPVHWTGYPLDMAPVLDIAKRRNLIVLEDACAAIGAKRDGKFAGSFARAAAFSFHPMKSLNAWGDGGAILTNDDRLDAWLRLYRNHGMINRDEIEFWGINSRLQSFQAVILDQMLDALPSVLRRRGEIAARIDEGLRDLPEVVVPRRFPDVVNAYQIYIVRMKRREELMKYLASEGVDSRVHYPIPLHLQKAARDLGYREGDFPVAEAQAKDIVTLPCHQYLTDDEVDYMVDRIRRFYRR